MTPKRRQILARLSLTLGVLCVVNVWLYVSSHEWLNLIAAAGAVIAAGTAVVVITRMRP